MGRSFASTTSSAGRRGRSPGAVRRLATFAAVAVLVPAAWLGPLAPASRAAVTVNLDQWASLDFAWQNGNLNGNNSRYPEGGSVPFRLAMEGLAVGSHEIHISYDFTAGGHKAYDFLATWNATNGAGAICTPSGGAISSMCPSLPTPATMTFPSDPFVTDGLSVSAAAAYAGLPRRMTIWGGTLTSMSTPAHSGSPAGNSDVEIVVRFKTTGSAVLLAWGGHLAQSSYWNKSAGGSPDGASLVSGAPWHVRTLGLDGAGSKNQDRSIQPSAIVGELPPGGVPAPTSPPGAAQPPTRPPVVPDDFGVPLPTLPNTAATSIQSRPGLQPANATVILIVVATLLLIGGRRWLGHGRRA